MVRHAHAPTGGWRTLDVTRQLDRVTTWSSSEAVTGLSGCVWQVSGDTDGSLLLVPESETQPGFAIVPADKGLWSVLVADPENERELGPFGLLDEALHATLAQMAAYARARVGHA